MHLRHPICVDTPQDDETTCKQGLIRENSRLDAPGGKEIQAQTVEVCDRMGGYDCWEAIVVRRQSLSIRSDTVLRLPIEWQPSESSFNLQFFPAKEHYSVGHFCTRDLQIQGARDNRCHTLVKILPLQWCCRFVNESVPLICAVERHTVWGLTRLDLRQHTATYCDPQQKTATHCNTLQRIADHCNPLQPTHTRGWFSTALFCRRQCSTLHHIATHCNTPSPECTSALLPLLILLPALLPWLTRPTCLADLLLKVFMRSHSCCHFSGASAILCCDVNIYQRMCARAYIQYICVFIRIHIFLVHVFNMIVYACILCTRVCIYHIRICIHTYTWIYMHRYTHKPTRTCTNPLTRNPPHHPTTNWTKCTTITKDTRTHTTHTHTHTHTHQVIRGAYTKMNHSCVCHASFICVPWRICMCAITHESRVIYTKKPWPT